MTLISFISEDIYVYAVSKCDLHYLAAVLDTNDTSWVLSIWMSMQAFTSTRELKLTRQ